MQQENKKNSKGRIKQFQGKIKRTEFVVFLILLVAHISFVSWCRPLVYNDYHINMVKPELAFAIANNYPSFSAILLGYLFLKVCYFNGFTKLRQKIMLLGSVVMGNSLYEGLDMLIGRGDGYDMLAIAMGGMFVLLCIFLNKN